MIRIIGYGDFGSKQVVLRNYCGLLKNARKLILSTEFSSTRERHTQRTRATTDRSEDRRQRGLKAGAEALPGLDRPALRVSIAIERATPPNMEDA